MMTTIEQEDAVASQERPVKMPRAWSALSCYTCGRPVGPEAAGSTECLLCTIQTA